MEGNVDRKKCRDVYKIIIPTLCVGICKFFQNSDGLIAVNSNRSWKGGRKACR